MRPLAVFAAVALLCASHVSAEPRHPHRDWHRTWRHVKATVKHQWSWLVRPNRHHHHHHAAPQPPAELAAAPPEPIEVYAETWVTLGHELSVAEPSRLEIPASPRPLRSLRIDCDGGTPRIARIIVDYAGGDTERLTVDAQLPPHGWRTLALDGVRPVRTITVVADPDSGGSYSVSGS